MDGSTVQHQDLVSALFPTGVRKLIADEKQFRKRFGRDIQEVGLMVNNVQSLHPQLWNGASGFLDQLYSHIGFPVGGALMDLFYGNYRSSFFRLHKDTQEIFAFIVSGKKRIYAWPFDTLSPFLSEEIRRTSNLPHHTDLNFQDYLDSAVCLDAEPGDIIYWPAEYWHIAAAATADKSFTAMLSLGLFGRANPYLSFGSTMLPEHQSQMREEFCPISDAKDDAASIRLLLTGMQNFKDEAGYRSAQEFSAMVFRSACGFRIGPHIDLKGFPKKLGRHEIQARDRFQRISSVPIYQMTSADNSSLIACNGLGIRTKASVAIKQLSRVLKSDETQSVQDLVKDSEASGSEAITYAYFIDRSGDKKLLRMSFESAKEQILWILGCLSVFGGLRCQSPNSLNIPSRRGT